MKWNKEDFHNFIVENEIVGFFEKPIKLKSGRLSYWYVNWRNVAEDVFLLDKLSDYLIEFINDLNLKPNCFYGVPEGATKLGVITQYKWAKSQSDFSQNKYVLSMGRGKPKDHGAPKDKFFLGVPKGKVIIIEDVTTTGGSLLEVIDVFLENNIEIIATIGLTNRNELRDDGRSVEKAVNEKNIQYYTMSNALDILPRLKPEREIALHIEDYFKKYGTKEVKLL